MCEVNVAVFECGHDVFYWFSTQWCGTPFFRFFTINPFSPFAYRMVEEGFFAMPYANSSTRFGRGICRASCFCYDIERLISAVDLRWPGYVCEFESVCGWLFDKGTVVHFCKRKTVMAEITRQDLLLTRRSEHVSFSGDHLVKWKLVNDFYPFYLYHAHEYLPQPS